jgi:membrane dipeptidase
MKLVDLHNDAITNLSPKRFLKYIKHAKKVGVETILISLWTTQMENPIQRIREYKGLLGDNLLLHIEDAWFLNETNIDEFIELRPFSVGLTWNEKNALAGGAYSNGGLTKLGKGIIQKLVASGIHIDLAHLNRKSFFGVAKLLDGQKLLCTHTCFDEVNKHPRNLNRKQIQTIIKSGGLIGVTFVQDFIGGGGVLAHIKYFLDNFGSDNLAIGTDFFGTTNLPKNLKKYNDIRRLKKHFNATTMDKIFHINWYEFQNTNRSDK